MTRKRTRRTKKGKKGGNKDTFDILGQMNNLDINTYNGGSQHGAGWGPDETFDKQASWGPSDIVVPNAGINDPTSNSRAVLVYYKNVFCGACSWFDSVWEGLIRDYTSKRAEYVRELNKKNTPSDKYPDFLEARVVYVNNEHPSNLPSDVDSVPAIVLYYIDAEGKVKERAIKYADMYKDATAKFMNQPVHTALNSYLLYDWLPTSLSSMWPDYNNMFPGFGSIFTYYGGKN